LSRGPSPADSRLYLITGVRPGLDELIEAAVHGGADIVQIREKQLPDRQLLVVLERVRELTRRLGVPFVVNDRPDLAMLVEADLVHVGQDDLPVDVARRLGLAVGLSTHAPEEIDRADADYIGVGPVYATPTKQGRPGVGLELVRHAAAHARMPWFALGGIDSGNVAEVVAAGAKRVAVIRAIADSPDPERAAAELRAALEGRYTGPAVPR
jgi:thiamine-phosphate pyrophosphorylase